MNKIIKILTIAFFTLLLVGCGGNQPKKIKIEVAKLSDFKVSSEKLDDGIIRISVLQEIKYRKAHNFKKGNYYAVSLLFKEILKNTNKPYFVVLNKGLSNLEGFPINNMNDFSDYMLYDHNYTGGEYGRQQLTYLKKGRNIRTKEFELFILPLNAQEEFFSTWSLQKLKEYYQNKTL